MNVLQTVVKILRLSDFVGSVPLRHSEQKQEVTEPVLDETFCLVPVTEPVHLNFTFHSPSADNNRIPDRSWSFSPDFGLHSELPADRSLDLTPKSLSIFETTSEPNSFKVSSQCESSIDVPIRLKTSISLPNFCSSTGKIDTRKDPSPPGAGDIVSQYQKLDQAIAVLRAANKEKRRHRELPNNS